MFAPPDDTRALRQLIWLAPGWWFVTWWATGWMLGFEPAAAAAVAAVTGVAVGALACIAVWRSRFGVLHTGVVGILTLLGVCLPAACILLPALPTARWSVPMQTQALWLASAHVLALFAATARQAAALPVPELPSQSSARSTTQPTGKAGGSGKRAASASRAPDAPASRQTWTDVGDIRIDLAKAVWWKPAAQPSRQSRVRPWVIGLATVPAYALLNALLDRASVAATGFLIGNALALWLSLGPISRALATAWRVHQTERALGIRFRHRQRAALQGPQAPS